MFYGGAVVSSVLGNWVGGREGEFSANADKKASADKMHRYANGQEYFFECCWHGFEPTSSQPVHPLPIPPFFPGFQSELKTKTVLRHL